MGFAGCAVAVVGGAGPGVGAGVVTRLLAKDAFVLVIDRDADRVGALLAEHDDSRVQVVTADVTTDVGVAAVRAALESLTIPLTGLVNAVGGVGADDTGHVLDVDVDRWRASIELNATAALRMSQAAALHMIDSGRGAIVNLSVADTARAMPWFAPYSASRSALESFTRSMAVELGPYGIRANSVSWGLVNSPRMHSDAGRDRVAERRCIPLGRRGDTSEVADAVVYLLSDESSYVTGTDLVVDGGLALVGPHYEGEQRIPVFMQSVEVTDRLRARASSLRNAVSDL